MSLVPGSRLGPYEITAQIGVGGMGEVYRATDTNLGRQVAIKVLPEAFAQDAERLARFEREAKTLASLNHPNIAIIHGLEKSPVEAGHYVRALVMELVEGPTLADRIAQGLLPIDEALPIARQIAEALEAAHEQGTIHRDLKPANVKVREDGTVKVLDFGLAKLVESGSGVRDSGFGGSHDRRQPDVTRSPTITTPAMTQIGMILGTAAYMSPEQARGKPLDKRSDVWAFGCVLFEMLTGRRAFDGEDTTDTIAAVVRGEPTWSALAPDVPASIRLLLHRCLEKDRKKRIGDISAALFVLNEPSLGGPGNAAEVRDATVRDTTMWKRSVPFLAGVALTAAIVGGVAWILRPSPTAQHVTRFSFSLPEGQLFTNAGRPVVAISPDGMRIVYVANRRLYLRSMSEDRPREIQGSEGAEGVTTPSFSPDGQSIVFVSAGERVLKRISVDGGVAVPICPIATSLGVSWSSEGIVFGEAPGNIFRVSPNGGKPQMILKAANGEAAYGAQLLPDGESMLVTIGRLNRGAGDPSQLENPRIVLQSLRSGERATLIERGADARYLPTGHLVYADGGALLAIRFDLEGRQVIGDSVPLIEGVRRGGATPAAQFSVSANGSLAYVPGSSAADFALAFLDRQGGSEVLKLRNASYNVPRLSPDGKRLAVEINDGKATNIWIYDLSGALAIRQLTLEGENRFPVWSGDGERVAFQSDRGGDMAIWWQRADGSSAAQQITEPEKDGQQAPLSWHPREPTLLYSVRQGTGRATALWTYSVTDRKARPFAGVESLQPLSAQFSPNGQWVAYNTTTGTRAAQVFVRPYPSTDAVYPVSIGTNPVWSPDGSELFFARASTIYVTRVTTRPSFATSTATAVPTGFWVPYFWRNYDVTPDGKRFLTLVAASGSDTGETSAQQIDVVLNWFEDVKRLVPTK